MSTREKGNRYTETQFYYLGGNRRHGLQQQNALRRGHRVGSGCENPAGEPRTQSIESLCNQKVLVGKKPFRKQNPAPESGCHGCSF